MAHPGPKAVVRSRLWLYAAFAGRVLTGHKEANRALRAGVRRRLARVWPALAVAPSTTAAAADNALLYERWRARYEPDGAQLAAQRRLGARRERPVFSILVPVFAPPADAFTDGICSVVAQTWPHWELILVMAGPQPAEVRAAAERAMEKDARIRLVEMAQNQGIAANTNAGLGAARGEYVLFLDHDDQLSPQTLFEAVREIDADPSVEQVSFDEDKLSPDGHRRHDPLFKPQAPSPEYLLSINHRMRSVVRKSVVDELGGLRSDVDGAQDWDLALRLLERGTRARHIPRVLYHWRQVPGSAAGDATAKPWAFAAQQKALEEHLRRQGLSEPAARHPQLGVTRVGWPLGRSPRVSIIIPTKDRAGLLDTCVRSIREKTTYPDYEILIIDTGSVEEATRVLYERLATDGHLRFLKDDRRPFNYSRVNNVGAREATGDVLVFLNNDIEVIGPDWLEEMVRWAVRPEIGGVGAKLIYPDGSLQHAGIVMGMGGHCSHVYQGGPADHTWGAFGSVDFYRNYLALGGACLAMRRAVFESLGGFDEQYELCYSDIALGLEAVQAGLRNVYTPFARLVHHEGGTRGRYFPPGDVLRASAHMYPLVVHGDPFYSPNLAYTWDGRIPTISVENDATGRAAQITNIASLFRVGESWERTLLDEHTGRTTYWKAYERLVRSLLPPAASFEPLLAPGDGRPAGGHRILLVTHELSRSGAPLVCLQLARYLSGEGHHVVVLSPRDGALREDFEEAGARVVVHPLAIEAAYVFAEPLASFDAVVPNTILAWPVVLAAKAAGRPVVWLVHESKFGIERSREGGGGVAEAFARADEVVFPSRATLALFRRLGDENLSAEHYGVDVPTPQESSRTDDRLRVVLPGSLEPRKGQDVLVAALARLPAPIRSRLQVEMIGRALDAGFEKRLREEGRGLDLRFLGERPRDETLARVAASDVAVCASRDETGPFVVLEAMGLGKAIVSTTVGVVPEVIEHGRNGLLVPPGDVQALSDALARILEDADLRRRLGESARETYLAKLTTARYGEAILRRLERAMAALRTP